MKPPTARRASLALAAAVLAASLSLAALARGQGSPVAGGTVPSVLTLSLGQPSAFRLVDRRRHLYAATIRAEATATDIPVRLSLVDGEAGGGRRHGHLVGGGSILPAALWAAASGRAYHPLDARAPAPLWLWSEPVSGTLAKIRLRQEAPSARALRNHHKLLLVTLMAGGP